MKSGLSLVALAEKIQREQANKKDLVASTKNMAAEVVDGSVKLVVGKDNVFEINDVAHQQIASHTGIPKAYYDKMKAETPDLLVANVNRWFSKEPHDRMVRAIGPRARAFLSDRYRPLENADLAEAVLPVLSDLGVDVMSCQITDSRLYIKVIDKKVAAELPAGSQYGKGHTIVKTRDVFAALTISNSEVGMGSLSALSGIYDTVCTNLATFNERSVRKYHVGAKHEIGGEDIYAILSEKTRALTDAATWSQIRDVVKQAFNQAKFDALVNKIKGAQEEPITGDVVKVIDFSAKKFGFSQTEKSSVLKHLIEGGDLSKFGFYNAVTRTAEDLPDYDRASSFERLGGEIIELPKSEWKQLAEAA